MAGDGMKQDTTLTINWFRMNVPTLLVVVAAATTGATWQTATEAKVSQNAKDIATLQGKMLVMENLPYRMEQVEKASVNTNVKVDNLSNTIINQMDLIRRDVNRLTTGVEVLSARVGLLTGEVDEPKRRRARPGPSELESLSPQ